MTTRPRMTRTREKREAGLYSEIMSLYHSCQVQGTPLHETHARAIERIRSADLLPSQVERLTREAWTLREWLVRYEAHWQLFVGEQPVKPEDIDYNRDWSRVAGMFVWRRFLPEIRPFYAAGEKPLNTSEWTSKEEVTYAKGLEDDACHLADLVIVLEAAQ